MRAVVALALATVLVVGGCLAVVPTPTPGPGTPDSAGGAPPSATPPATGTGLSATVVEVVDGDTIEVELENGSRDTVRLLGVDTPEVHSENDPTEFEGVPDTAAGADCLRSWGERASDYARNVLLGAEVTLVFDENEPRRGYYDRLLAYVYVGNREFNYGLVTRGYARVYDSEFVRGERYYEAEAAAMDSTTGLWGCREPGSSGATPTPTTVTDGGTATTTGTATASESGLRVVEVHADAEGHDGDNLNDEYVVFANAGDEALNVSGWVVADGAGHTYTFPDGVVLDPDEQVVLHTGSGEDGGGDLYWGQSQPVWNNDGDTVVVRTENGSEVLRYEYG